MPAKAENFFPLGKGIRSSVPDKGELSSGLLLLDKQAGITSFDALNAVKKAFATKKVGHTGTLDKFASGLLLVLIGRSLKLVHLFENCAKEYTGTISFGAETDTLDPEGEIVARAAPPELKDIEAVLDNFRGDIMQAPPAYSALHINGKRAYELAREGKEPEMKKRPVTIYELEILSWTPCETVIKARVSAGTYIRSLARDIALAAGSRAHLSALKRTKIGPFCLEDATGKNITEALHPDEFPRARELLHPIDQKLFKALSIPCFFLIDKKTEEGFIHGRPLETLLPAECKHPTECKFPENTEARCAGIFSEAEPDKLLGVIKKNNDRWEYANVYAGN